MPKFLVRGTQRDTEHVREWEMTAKSEADVVARCDQTGWDVSEVELLHPPAALPPTEPPEPVDLAAAALVVIALLAAGVGVLDIVGRGVDNPLVAVTGFAALTFAACCLVLLYVRRIAERLDQVFPRDRVYRGDRRADNDRRRADPQG